MERAPMRESRISRFNEWFIWPLGVALVALLLELGLLWRRGPLP
jgi:hypothetical protein